MKNQMVFENREQADKLLKFLLDFNADSNEDVYNDIHIYQEECFIVIEWVTISYNHDYGGQFEYVDEDQEVMLCKLFPDNHYEYFSTEEEYQEALAEWKNKQEN